MSLLLFSLCLLLCLFTRCTTSSDSPSCSLFQQQQQQHDSINATTTLYLIVNEATFLTEPCIISDEETNRNNHIIIAMEIQCTSRDIVLTCPGNNSPCFLVTRLFPPINVTIRNCTFIGAAIQFDTPTGNLTLLSSTFDGENTQHPINVLNGLYIVMRQCVVTRGRLMELIGCGGCVSLIGIVGGVEIHNTTIRTCKVGNRGGCLFIAGHNHSEEDITPRVFGGDVVITDSVLEQCVTLGASSGLLRVLYASSIIARGNTFRDGTAKDFEGCVTINDIGYGKIEFSSNTIDGCKSNSSNGCVSFSLRDTKLPFSASREVYVDNNTVRNCKTVGYSGGIQLADTARRVRMTNLVVSHVTSGLSFGAIRLVNLSSPVVLENITVEDVSILDGDGGVLAVWKVTNLTLSGLKVRGPVRASRGGGMLLQSLDRDSVATFRDVVFEDSTAARWGGPCLVGLNTTVCLQNAVLRCNHLGAVVNRVFRVSVGETTKCVRAERFTERQFLQTYTATYPLEGVENDTQPGPSPTPPRRTISTTSAAFSTVALVSALTVADPINAVTNGGILDRLATFRCRTKKKIELDESTCVSTWISFSVVVVGKNSKGSDAVLYTFIGILMLCLVQVILVCSYKALYHQSSDWIKSLQRFSFPKLGITYAFAMILPMVSDATKSRQITAVVCVVVVVVWLVSHHGYTVYRFRPLYQTTTPTPLSSYFLTPRGRWNPTLAVIAGGSFFSKHREGEEVRTKIVLLFPHATLWVIFTHGLMTTIVSEIDEEGFEQSTCDGLIATSSAVAFVFGVYHIGLLPTTVRLVSILRGTRFVLIGLVGVLNNNNTAVDAISLLHAVLSIIENGVTFAVSWVEAKKKRKQQHQRDIAETLIGVTTPSAFCERKKNQREEEIDLRII
eukprot:PhF_6_TR27940/c1_g1_i1/m.41181